MENNTVQLSQPQPRFPLKRIIFIIIALIVVVGTVVAALSISHSISTENQVKDAVKSVVTLFDKAKAAGNGYPASLPTSDTSPKGVKITTQTSFSGATYCIDGTSESNSKVSYYAASASSQLQKGTCQSATTLPVPGAVEAVSLQEISSSDVKFLWQSVPTSEHYSVQCATDKAFSAGLIKSQVDTTTATCTKLQSGTNYYIRVSALNKSGNGTWSPILQVKTNDWSSPPANLTVTPKTSTQMNYSWNAVSGAELYVIEWAKDENFLQSEGKITQTTTSGTIKNLTAGTSYWFHVKAVTPEFDVDHATFSAPINISTSAS